jgi:predicted exporter
VLITLEGNDRDRAALRAFGDAIVPRLLALGPEIVSSAEDGPHEARKFLSPRAGLFLERAELERLRRDVDERWDYEVAKKTDTLLDDSSPPPPLTADDLKRRFAHDAATHGRGEIDRFPDGYYEHMTRTGDVGLVVVARSPIAGGDLARTGPALHRIHAAVDEARVATESQGNAAIRVSYAGDMPAGFIEYGVVMDDLLSVGAIGIALVLSAVLFYFMRVRAVLVMGITILVGLLWTFGLTELVIGHLNVATAFLISIVAGNGINVGILYQSRYFEERRRGLAPADALRTAVHTTWQPTIIAAVAAAASYGSLLVTDFRAFRHFGFIAGVGMLICWIVKTLMVPPLLVLIDRSPTDASNRWTRRFGLGYGRVFAALVPKAPRVFVAVGTAVGLLGGAAAVLYATRDPMEYDMQKVQNDRTRTADLHHAWAVATDVLGAGQGAMVVLTDTPEEARELDQILRARWDAAPPRKKPFVGVQSLWSFVPDDQEAKLPTLLALGERLRRAHERGFIDDEDWRRIHELLPPPNLRPFGVADLPAEIARPFTERDGTRGTLVLIEAEPTESDDLHYLLRYADSFRETRLPSGKVVRGSGRAVIFADMLKATVRDIPRAVSLSLGMTLLTVFLTFRGASRSTSGRAGAPSPTLGVLFALAVGIGGVGAFLYAAHVRLNFLNFAALPITFGIGVDYAVNVAQRYQEGGSEDVLAALRTSGGAVVLCSLTTMLGYLALLGSHNRAIRGLGVIAVMGEVSCLLAAVLVLPALWYLFERKRAQ